MNDIAFSNIQLDIAGSFFMNLIGQNMTSFVKIIQKMVTPPNPILLDGLSKLYVENVTLDKRFDNALIPRARPRNNEIVAEVHWIFVVKEHDEKSLLNTIHMKSGCK